MKFCPANTFDLRRWLMVILVTSFTQSGLPDSKANDQPPADVTNSFPRPLRLAGIQNAYQISKTFFSGSQPEGEDAFAAIANLGVKTILSVDGSKPDLTTARKFGLRYIHLPIGYDGISTNRTAELAKLAADINGKIFVHCHHGLHRGPAAVAVMCEASENWTTSRAVEWLRMAGTSTDYPGLFRAASDFRMPPMEQLDAITSFPELTEPSSLIDAMVAIDGHFSALKKSQKATWRTPDTQTLDAETTLLLEKLKELTRDEDTATRPEDYRRMLDDSVQATLGFRTLLRGIASTSQKDTAFKKLNQTCVTCHGRYRNE